MPKLRFGMRRGFTGLEIITLVVLVGGLIVGARLTQQPQQIDSSAHACGTPGPRCDGGRTAWCYDDRYELGTRCCNDANIANWFDCPGPTPDNSGTCYPGDPTALVCRGNAVGSGCTGFAGTCVRTTSGPQGYSHCGCQASAPTSTPRPAATSTPPPTCANAGGVTCNRSTHTCAGSELSIYSNTSYRCCSEVQGCRLLASPTPTRTPTPIVSNAPTATTRPTNTPTRIPTPPPTCSNSGGVSCLRSTHTCGGTELSLFSSTSYRCCAEVPGCRIIPSPTATPRPSNTPTRTPTPIVSNAPTSTSRPTNTPTRIPTSTSRPSSTPAQTPTPSVQPGSAQQNLGACPSGASCFIGNLSGSTFQCVDVLGTQMSCCSIGTVATDAVGNRYCSSPVASPFVPPQGPPNAPPTSTPTISPQVASLPPCPVNSACMVESLNIVGITSLRCRGVDTRQASVCCPLGQIILPGENGGNMRCGNPFTPTPTSRPWYCVTVAGVTNCPPPITATPTRTALPLQPTPRPLLPIRGLCGTNHSVCASGYCAPYGLCAARQTIGGLCVEDAGCRSGQCVNFACQLPATPTPIGSAAGSTRPFVPTPTPSIAVNAGVLGFTGNHCVTTAQGNRSICPIFGDSCHFICESCTGLWSRATCPGGPSNPVTPTPAPGERLLPYCYGLDTGEGSLWIREASRLGIQTSSCRSLFANGVCVGEDGAARCVDETTLP